MEAKSLSKNKQKKQQLVAEIKEKVEKAKSLVFANYQGLTHKQLEQLKRAIKAVDAELLVTKNTLLKRALETTDYRLQTTAVDGGQSTVDQFEGPTATLFAYGDPIAPLKELAKTIKLLKLPAIKLGILEGKALTAEEVLKLASIPSRDILIAQVVLGLKSPIFGLHRALVWNMQKLVLTLSAIQQKKS